MATCQLCSARTDLFICRVHTDELRSTLAQLPQFLDWLNDAALKQTRMGDGVGRSSGRRDIKGDDDALTECTCGHKQHRDTGCRHVCAHQDHLPDACPYSLDAHHDCDCTEYVPDVEKLRRRVLSAATNPRAAALYAEVRNGMATTIRDLCETRSITLVHPRFIGPLRIGQARGPGRGCDEYASWLTSNLGAIASSENAGETVTEFRGYLAAIEKAINKPIPRLWLGKCPSYDDTTRTECGNELYAQQDAIEVTCRSCRRTYTVALLQKMMMDELERKRMTVAKILKVNKALPEEYQISERAFRHWRTKGKIKPRGYVRPDGREVINRHSDADEPLYAWADITRLRGAKV